MMGLWGDGISGRGPVGAGALSAVRRLGVTASVLGALACGSCRNDGAARDGAGGGQPAVPDAGGDRAAPGSGGDGAATGGRGGVGGGGSPGSGGAATGGKDGGGGGSSGSGGAAGGLSGSAGGAAGLGAGGSGGRSSAGGGPGGQGASMGGGGAAGRGGGGGVGGSGGGAVGGGGADGGVVAADVRWLGRVALTDPARPRFAWSGTGFVARFTGDSLAVRLANDDAFVFKAVVDGAARPAFAATRGEGTYTLASALQPDVHTVVLYRQTEGVYGDSQLLAVTATGGALMAPPPPSGRLVQVVGASVSCGYGDLGTPPCGFSYATESHYDTYESVAARALDAELEVVAISGRGMYRNSDGTTTGTMPLLYTRAVPGSATPAWDFRGEPQAVVINLGKNDFGVGDPGMAFVDAYVAFARMLRQRYPRALIVCTTGPNLGAANHARQITYVDAAIAARQRDGDTALVALDWPEENAAETGCDDHPNAAKQRTMGSALADLLRTRLGW